MKQCKIVKGVILALLAAAIITGDCKKSYGNESAPNPTAICCADPSATYCAELGYTYERGLCVFPDNTSCSSWGFYRGECGTQWSYCEKHGGEIKNIVDDMGSWYAPYGVCIFNDGSECLEQDYLGGRCKPSECTKWLMSMGGCLKSDNLTTTTTQPTTTTTTQPATTTATPDNSSTCPAQKVLGEDNPQLESLRNFRDSRLANTAVGRRIIQIYYNNADSINAALERSPALRAATRKVLEAIAPIVGRKEEDK